VGSRGRLLCRDDPDYERHRRDAIWNARRPARFPELILLAAGEADVAAGVRLAAARGLRIGVRSGGHSWIANGVRHGGLTIDLSALATVAYGWNARVHGPACVNIVAADVALADGRLVRAGDDVLWALRGSGPGFFGVVVRLYLRTFARPAIARAVRVYPLAALGDVESGAWSSRGCGGSSTASGPAGPRPTWYRACGRWWPVPRARTASCFCCRGATSSPRYRPRGRSRRRTTSPRWRRGAMSARTPGTARR
jgi:hypothetical protein